MSNHSRMTRTLYTSIGALVLLIGATPAQAQGSRPERPNRGLFGNTGSEMQQVLSGSGSLGGGYATDLARDARQLTPLSIGGDRVEASGALGQFSGSLSYSLTTETSSLSGSAGTSGRYYPSAKENKFLRREYATVQASTAIGAGLKVFGGASYSPFRIADFYSVSLAPEVGEPSDAFDFGSSYEHFISYSSGAEWGMQLSRRTHMRANYRFGGRATSVEVAPYNSHQAGGSLRHNVGRGLDVTIGYRYAEARRATGDPYVTHAITAGVDFRRSLSISRRTTLAFSTGTDAYEDPRAEEGLKYRAVGNVSLNHEIGRTWSALLSYDRQLRFSETLLEPIFSDAVTAGVSGLINRRLRLHARGGASTGQLAANSDGDFDTYYTDASMTFGLSRYAAIGSAYRYHYHGLADGFGTPAGIPATLGRHSAQVYVSLWAPIYQRARRP